MTCLRDSVVTQDGAGIQTPLASPEACAPGGGGVGSGRLRCREAKRRRCSACSGLEVTGLRMCPTEPPAGVGSDGWGASRGMGLGIKSRLDSQGLLVGWDPQRN